MKLNRVKIPEQIVEVKSRVAELTRTAGAEAAVQQLRQFDVGGELFLRAAENASNMGELSQDVRIFREAGADGRAVRTAIVKKWAKPLDYDCDASLYVGYAFWKTVFPEETQCPIRSRGGWKCAIKAGGRTYQGETINSWATTVREFFRLFGGGENGYLEGMIVNDMPGENEGKWRLPVGQSDWEVFLSTPGNYHRELPAYITEFLDVVYTMGNFTVVPFGCNIYTALRDYWDLKLLCIYNWYRERKDLHLLGLVCDRNSDSSVISDRLRAWTAYLERFEDWDVFVEKTDMQPYVEKNGRHFGRPLELWDGHFNSCCGLPETEPEFRQFFVNAKKRISARGELTAKRLVREIKAEASKAC